MSKVQVAWLVCFYYFKLNILILIDFSTSFIQPWRQKKLCLANSPIQRWLDELTDLLEDVALGRRRIKHTVKLKIVPEKKYILKKNK